MMDCYRLDNYLTKEYIYRNLPKKQINYLPNIDTILLKLKAFLKENELSNTMVGQGQLYTYTIKFSNGDFCNMSWDIDKAKIIAKCEHLNISSLSIDRLARTISNESVDPVYLKEALHNHEPIIIAILPMLNDLAVLDGNHRVISRYKINKKMVKGYVLYPHQHYFAMIDDTSRAIFLVLNAIKYIYSYLVGGNTEEELMSCIKDIDNFYDISVQKEMLDMLGGN